MSRRHPELQSQRRRAFSPFINFFSTRLPEFGPGGRSQGYVSELIVVILPLSKRVCFLRLCCRNIGVIYLHARKATVAENSLSPKYSICPRHFAFSRMKEISYSTSGSLKYPPPLTTTGCFALQLQRAGKM